MKRTEIERRLRDVKRIQKREKQAQRREENADKQTPGALIAALYDRLYFGEERIFNLEDDINVLEILEEIKDSYPDKLESIVRKAVKKTGVKEREPGIRALVELVGE